MWNLPKPAPPNLTNLQVNNVVYFCTSYLGKSGLGAKIFTIKNNGSADFTYTGKVDINATVGEWADLISTDPNFNVAIKAGKTFDIYPKDIDRAGAPYLFLNNKANIPMSLRFGFGETGYVDYSKTLAFQDFATAGCP